MNFTLNIGLASETIGTIHPDTAIACLKAHGFGIGSHAVQKSETEDTLVVEVFGNPIDNDFNRRLAVRQFNLVSIALGQDCISVWNPTQKRGALIGPNYKKWNEGVFNPAWFLLHDGTTLQAAQDDQLLTDLGTFK